MIEINYLVNGIKTKLQCSGTAENEHMAITFFEDVQETKQSITIVPKTTLTLGNIYFTKQLVNEATHVQLNGYQSWTDSDQVTGEEVYKPCNPLFNYIFKNYGDYGFTKTTGKKGQFNSYHYVIYKADDDATCFYSSDEQSANTIFEVDFSKSSMRVRRDYEGKKLHKDEVLKVLTLCTVSGTEDFIYRTVFSKRSYKPISGWTSWYNYYTNIDHTILNENLDDIIAAQMPYDVFQIDDGYQNAVGDWLTLKPSFKSGLAELANKAKANGMKAGLWLAPFVAERNSNLYKTHKNWFVKLGNRTMKAGWNPGWSGNFYTLDIYNNDVRAYLREVFDTVRHVWGFNFVKLDFLYAIASSPYYGKTRAEIMYDGVQLLRELCGDMEILGCGVPLGQAKDSFEYCRIGSDVAPYYEDAKLKMLAYRERVSTYNSLKSTIGRSMLNGHYFINDPDVFLMREENNHMNDAQKHTLFVLNNLLGGLVFTSDKLGNYSDKILTTVKTMYPQRVINVLSMMKHDDCYHIVIESRQRAYSIYANLSDMHIHMKADRSMVNANKLYTNTDSILIKPYTTTVLAHIDNAEGVVWSDNHVLPLGNLEFDELSPINVDSLTLSNSGIKPSEIVYLSSKEQADAYLGQNKGMKIYKRFI